MVSWTCRCALLNWRTLRSGGVFWLRGAAAISQQGRAAQGLLGKMSSRSILEGGCYGKISPWCIPRRSPMAKCSRTALPGVRQWQDVAAMRSRAAIRGSFFASCVPEGASDGKSTSSRQHIAAMHPKRAGFGKIFAPCIRKAPQTGVRECTARIPCREGALFAARAPHIMHGAKILPFLGARLSALIFFGRGRCSRFAHPPASCSRPSCARSCARSPSAPPAPCPRCWVCLPRRPRAASSRPHLCRRVRDGAETAGSCRLPQKTWRCDGVSLNCRCSAVLF